MKTKQPDENVTALRKTKQHYENETAFLYT